MISVDRIDPALVTDRAAFVIELEMECLRSEGAWSDFFGLKQNYFPELGTYPGED